MKRSFPREMLMLSAPLLLVVGVAFWAMRRRKPIVPPVKKWRIEGEIVRRVPLPVEARRGSDTQFQLIFRVLSPKDQPPSSQGSFWNDVRLVETDEGGKERRVWDDKRYFYDFPSNDWEQVGRLFFGGRGGGGGDGWSTNYGFALRRLPHPTRRLELRVDSVWRPIATQGMIMDATPGQVAQMRALPDALSTSRRWVLRKAGEITPTPRVSTDPFFDIHSVEFQPIAKGLTGEPSVQVVWHVFWRGPLNPKQIRMSVPARLGLYDEKNNPFGMDDNDLRSDWRKGRSFAVRYDDELSYARSRAKELGSKNLFLRGWISMNGCWPRQVNLQLPKWVLQE